MNKSIVFAVLAMAFTGVMTGQDNNAGQNPVEEDFNNVIESSNDYQGYKVVDYNELINLRNTTSQRFARINEDIISQQETIDQQQNQIVELQNELESTRQDLERVSAEKDEISFLGIPFSKSGYQTFMLSIIGLLVLALLFFIYKYKSSHEQTREARDKYNTTEKEFEAYRAKALEKEQRLGRLLQDERNKSSDK